MNRNYEEEVDIPVGPDNHFEPGGDRGQPTHFVVRRHKDVFKIVLPKDFGDRTLVWTLTAHGQTAQVAGTLKPVWMIDRLRTTRGGNSEKINSNTPPQVSIEPPERTITGPGSVTLTVSATDDGLPARGGKAVGMTAIWAMYRGPAAVVFGESKRSLSTGGLLPPQASAGWASTSCRSWWMTVPASPQEILDITAVGRTLRRRSLSTEEAMMARNTSSFVSLACRPGGASGRARAGRKPSSDFQQRCRAHFPESLPDLSSSGHVRANVAGDVPGSEAVGTGHQTARRAPRHAAMAPR